MIKSCVLSISSLSCLLVFFYLLVTCLLFYFPLNYDLQTHIVHDLIVSHKSHTRAHEYVLAADTIVTIQSMLIRQLSNAHKSHARLP